MYRTVSAKVDVFDVVNELDDGDLKELGLMRLAKNTEQGIEVWPGDMERMKLNALRGDLRGFLEAVEAVFGNRGVNLRIDRLMDAAARVPA